MPLDNQHNQQEARSSMSMLGTAWSIVGGMIGCSLLGYFIGGKLGDSLIGTLVGMVLGLMYCGYEIWKLLRQDNSSSKTR